MRSNPFGKQRADGSPTGSRAFVGSDWHPFSAGNPWVAGRCHAAIAHRAEPGPNPRSRSDLATNRPIEFKRVAIPPTSDGEV